MNLLEKLKSRLVGKKKPEHLRHGELGERAAKQFLRRHGLKFLAANFRSGRGEIDLIFRDDDCLAFIEVKTRSSEDWVRPAAAVDAERRRRLSQCALDYLRLLKNPAVKGILVNIPFVNSGNMYKTAPESSWNLPLPAVFVVNQDGTIGFSEAHADFRVRPEPADVMEAVLAAVAAK